MELIVLSVAFFVVLGLQWWSHKEEREEWHGERQLLLDRIQTPHLVEAKRSEAIEPGGVSYVGAESDDDGITGARDETQTE